MIHFLDKEFDDGGFNRARGTTDGLDDVWLEIFGVIVEGVDDGADDGVDEGIPLGLLVLSEGNPSSLLTIHSGPNSYSFS